MTIDDPQPVLTGAELAGKYPGLCDLANDEGDDD